MKGKYEKTIYLNHNESAAIIDKESGEVREVTTPVIPKGKSLLEYKDFAIVNSDAVKELSFFLSNEELGIIIKMIQRADFKSNNLKPLSDETSIRQLSEEFNIGKNKVSAIFKKLFEIGVYAHIKIHEDTFSEYWILNPYISWKGRLKEDSIFHHFKDTKIAKLLQNNSGNIK